ncbi:MAG: 2-oxoglutarate dehydrogenase complex dihydrolipoyllysine-residue succinyltransferase [Alphaproteobacteria bacterium]|nr:2-oxoglutarate dehydrogenase complex dihydrolipoyllysine-residue succinyltransferase [Alphaproteobacteria bacterium]
MAVDIKVPTLGESVTEATVAKWFKGVGDAVAADEPLVELETDKVTVEVPSPSAGTIAEIKAAAGATVNVGAILGAIAEGAAPAKKAAPAAAAKPAAAPAASAAGAKEAGPAARKLMAETGVVPAGGSGKDGRVTKADVVAAATGASAPASAPAPAPVATPAPQPAAPHVPRALAAREERVKMTRLRKRIAERLKQAQNTAAMLTTFNEADMSAVMALRERYKDGFEKRHGVKLGFMGFFVKACVAALKEIPAVNAEIDGDDIIFKNHYDVGVAVGTEQGLVVPVVRDCDALSIADVEKKIGEFGKKARDGKLGLDDLQGGTFTISNGGVYGSLMSTPILNPPQSGILGMHKIQPRPIAVGDRIEIRPMMYLALSYDHRIIDGREAVTFLVRVKEAIEDPQRLVLDM